MSELPIAKLEISPEPTPAEAAVIAATIVAISPKVPEDTREQRTDRWREAGKREAIRPLEREKPW